jgi:hypothetical protein
MKRKGFYVATEQEIIRDHIDLEVAFRRDPNGLCQAVGAALNEILRDDPIMKGWEWGLDWHNLPGAISVSVSGTNRGQIDAFFAATSVAEYNEVDEAAKRLAHRIRRCLGGNEKP